MSERNRENLRIALRRSAVERQCPKCNRKSAMQLYSQDSISVVETCRYCGHVRVTRGPTT